MRKTLIYKKRVQDETGREYILWYSLVIRVAEHGRIYGVEIEKTNEYGRQERALIAGISAKEVVVSSCAVLFGVPNINSGAGMDTLVGILSASGFGQLNAFCLMVFCLLYIPCAAALATIRKESGSTRWMLLSALFQLVVAWVVTFIVYRIGLFI